MLSPPKKIEAEKNGVLHFLAETFGEAKWTLPKELFDIVVNIRGMLMEIYDAMYRFQEERNIVLDLDDFSFMICRTIECLPAVMKTAPRKPTLRQTVEQSIAKLDKDSQSEEEQKKNQEDEDEKGSTPEGKEGEGQPPEDSKVLPEYDQDQFKEGKSEPEEDNGKGTKIERVKVEVSGDAPPDKGNTKGGDSQEMPHEDTHKELNDGSLQHIDTYQRAFFRKKEDAPKEQSINEEDMIAQRKIENFDYVIENIKKYIIDNNMTIRDAFKIFDTNVDQKVDRLELKRSIKDICRSQVAYQQVEDAVDYIEQTMGGSSTGALAFAEFGTALKKALKKAQYHNYKPKPDEGTISSREMRLSELGPAGGHRLRQLSKDQRRPQAFPR